MAVQLNAITALSFEAFGEIYAEGNAVETVISVSGTWYQVEIFTNNGQSYNTTPSKDTNDITIDVPGKYLVFVSASILSGSGGSFKMEMEVKLNNGVTPLPNLHTARELDGGGGDFGAVSLSGIVDLSLNDTIEVWIKNITNTTNMIFEDINLTVLHIGV